ncbi:MAG: AMP-binding protein, partial [Candidatus Binatia bacterium]
MAMQTPPLLMSILLDRGARVAPGEEVVTFTADGVHRQTLEQTHRRACRLANALSSHGIAIGDRVASFMWNNHRHLEMYQALPSMGAVLHTLNIRLSTGDLEYIINHAGDRVVVVDEDLLPQLERLAEMIPCVERVVVCSDNGGWTTTLPNAVDYEDFIAAEPSVYDWPALSENAPMGLCYTSGTTGNPKGVMYTHRSTYLHTIAVCLRDALALSATDCVCGIVPMFHAMGWGVPFAALMVGSKQVMN